MLRPRDGYRWLHRTPCRVPSTDQINRPVNGPGAVDHVGRAPGSLRFSPDPPRRLPCIPLSSGRAAYAYCVVLELSLLDSCESLITIHFLRATVRCDRGSRRRSRTMGIERIRKNFSLLFACYAHSCDTTYTATRLPPSHALDLASPYAKSRRTRNAPI